MHAFIAATQILTQQIVPRIARTASVLVLALPLTPLLVPAVPALMTNLPLYMLSFAKEAALGFIMGYLLFWLFWAVQTAGTVIDNQRGTAIASSIDPPQGHGASPMGILFSQAFTTCFFSLGRFLVVVGLVCTSHTAWPVTSFLPIFDPDVPKLILEVVDTGMRLCVRLSAPIIVIMFVAEFALAMVSRFAPQVQVFILAMPIKSAIAMLILLFFAHHVQPCGRRADTCPRVLRPVP
jgi:type III secretion protein T